MLASRQEGDDDAPALETIDLAMAKGKSRREKRQKARRISALSDAQVALGWFVILALAALVGAIYVSQASRIAGAGRQVQLLQNRLDDLKRENAELERDIAEAQTLERLQQEAIRLGFVRAAPEDIEYVVVEGYPQATPPPSPPSPTPAFTRPAESMTEAIWLAVRGSVDGLVRGEAGE